MEACCGNGTLQKVSLGVPVARPGDHLGGEESSI
jgi:hypothetical protein